VLKWTWAALAVLLASSPARADTVALKSGALIEGTIANAEPMRSGRIYSSFVSILSDDELLRIPLDDVDYLVIETGDEVLVLDPSQPGTVVDPSKEAVSLEPLSSDYRSRRKELTGKKNLGTVLTIAGVAAAIVGVAIKFGDEELRISSDSATIEKTYNATNYILMGGGAALTIAGVATTVSAEGDIRDLEREMGLRVSFAF
jgi:hypothetical protein